MLHLLLTLALQPAAASLEALAARHPGSLRLSEAGRSYRNRSIQLMTLGTGERRMLLWSQMHGDEPSATPALLGLADYLLCGEGGQAEEPAP